MLLSLRVIGFLLLACCWSGAAAPLARAESLDCSHLPQGFQFRTYHDDTGDHRYAVFTPTQYDPARKWPVVMFLHGAGEKGTDAIYPLFGMLTVALEKWPDSPFVAVFPQCEDLTGRALTGWLADSADGRRAMKILDDVEKSFSIDPEHRILTGWSMGGYGVWSLAAAHPRHWSAVMPLAGGTVDPDLPLDALAAAKTPVWAINGREDPLVPYQQSEKLVQRLNEAGGKGTFTLLSGASHDICQRVFASQQTFQWLLNPDSIDPSTIDLKNIELLPPRTKFYSECLVETRVIPDSLALRLGNATFEQLAPEIPHALETAPLQGELHDITKTVGSGSDQVKVAMSKISYHCELSRCWLHGICGGRLGMEVDFFPLVMTIGETTLETAKHHLKTGPIEVRIGIHQPARLTLEVQPTIETGKLKLRLLRKKFDFAPGNWYIQPPTEVEGHSDQYTPDQLVTGIIGSLYEGRQEFENQLLAMVPELLKRAESELEMRDAPGLAKMLSPLPVLVPDLKVSPSQVTTDAQGISVICDLNVSVRGKVATVLPVHELTLASVTPGDQLAVDVSLDAISALSQMNVDQNFAQVNVLDISADKFGELADPKVMNQIMPGLDAKEGESLNTILRLLNPLTMQKGPEASSPDDLHLILQSTEAAIDVWRPTETSQAIPAGRIVFKLSQPISITSPVDRKAPHAALKVQWAEGVKVVFLRAESLQGSPVPEVKGQEFEKLFGDAWSTWGREHGTQTIPLEVGRLGSTQLRLNSMKVSDREMDLIFEASAVATGTDQELSQQLESDQ